MPIKAAQMQTLVKSVMVVLGIALASPASAETSVFSCEPEWAALAREVGGGNVKAYSGTHARQDPHHIRAKPSLIAAIRKADLLICSGAGLEIGWLPILLRRGAPAELQPGRPGHLMASEHVNVLEKPTVIDRSLGDIHPEGNPHVHLDARNLVPIARELARRLQTVDTTNAATYARRTETFVRKWSRLLAEWKIRAATLEGMPVIVHHKSWAYLIQWLGLKEVGTLEPRPGIQPTPAHLTKLLSQSRTRPAKAILRTPYDPPEASDWLSAKTGIPVLTLPFTVEKEADRDALQALFDTTLDMLERANRKGHAGS